jgi:hypothetical protein
VPAVLTILNKIELLLDLDALGLPAIYFNIEVNIYKTNAEYFTATIQEKQDIFL